MKFWILTTIRVLVLAIVTQGGMAGLWAQSESPLASLGIDDGIEAYKITDQPLEGVLEILSQLTDRAIVRPQSLPNPQITFDSGGPITKGELILALETLLSLNGIGISPLGDRFLKVVPLNILRSEAPELVTDSLAARNPSGQVVSKIFRLQHLDSQTFQQQVQPFMSPGFSQIIPFENSNAVLVTDTISNLQRLEYVVSEVDKPLKLNITPIFFTLQFAQASEVAQQLQGLIDDARSRFGAQNPQQGGASRVPQGGDPNVPTPIASPSGTGGEGAIPTQLLFGSSTAITADDRTNQLIIMTDPSSLPFFEDIIQKLDIKADPATRIEVIPLKHADATEVASLLSQFVSGKTKSDSSDRSPVNTRERNTQPRSTFGDRTTPRAETNATSATVSTAGGLGVEDRDSQFSDFMTIVADERSNALVISGTRSDLELMSVLISKIDVLLPQVRIEVIIAEVNLDKGSGVSRGIDAFQVDFVENEDGDGGQYSLSDINILGLGVKNTVFDYADGVTSNLTISGVLNKAKESSDVRLLSVPTLVTTHNKEATIIVGEAQPIITGSQTDLVGSTTTRSTVQFRDIGIELTVTPLIGPNDVIQLEIDQKIDDIADTVTIDGNQQPIIGRRQAISYVGVRDGELIVLGGLQRHKTTKGDGGPALLGEIPLVGKLFSRRTRRFEKSELMVFIRPKVIRNTNEVNVDAQEKLTKQQISEKLKSFLEDGSIFTEEFEGFENIQNKKDDGADSLKAQRKGFRKR